jgi:hypothetical protein
VGRPVHNCGTIKSIQPYDYFSILASKNNRIVLLIHNVVSSGRQGYRNCTPYGVVCNALGYTKKKYICKVKNITIMKRLFTIAATILFVTAGCGGNKQSTDELIIVDLTTDYPEKELILQDFMDVEYIPLETNDEFVTQGKVMAVGTEIILITNWINDGDLFVFDRKTGKGLRKINRKGQGGEEYVGIIEIVLDEANNEMFVIAYAGSKISVYDLYGNFKRSFKAGDADHYINTFNYDRENLISYIPDNSLENPSNVMYPYYLIFSNSTLTD